MANGYSFDYGFNNSSSNNNNKGGGTGLGTIVFGVFIALVLFAVIG